MVYGVIPCLFTIFDTPMNPPMTARCPMKQHQNTAFTCLFAFCLTAVLSSCSEAAVTHSQTLSSEPASTVVIGALFPLTGGLSQYGEAAEHAARIAVDEINADGGIRGSMLEVDIQDHQCNPKTAATIFEQLSSAKGITIFTSAACSGTVLAIAPLLESHHAMLLGTIVTTPKISGVSPFVFRNWASDGKQADLYAQEIKRRGYRTVGIIYEQTDYAQGLFISIQRLLNGTGIIIHGEGFEPGATDVRTLLAKLQQEQPEALFISPQTVTTGDIVLKQMRELGFRPQGLLVNDNILKSKDLLLRYPDMLEGAISGDYVMEHSPRFSLLLETYKKRFGTDCPQPNICAGVYDAIHLLALALRESGQDANLVSTYLKDMYLKEAPYSGASGNISFDGKNDRNNADYSLFVIREGTPITVS